MPGREAPRALGGALRCGHRECGTEPPCRSLWVRPRAASCLRATCPRLHRCQREWSFPNHERRRKIPTPFSSAGQSGCCRKEWSCLPPLTFERRTRAKRPKKGARTGCRHSTAGKRTRPRGYGQSGVAIRVHPSGVFIYMEDIHGRKRIVGARHHPAVPPSPHVDWADGVSYG